MDWLWYLSYSPDIPSQGLLFLPFPRQSQFLVISQPLLLILCFHWKLKLHVFHLNAVCGSLLLSLSLSPWERLYGSDHCFHAKDSESGFLVLAQSWDHQLSAPNPCIPEADSLPSSWFSYSYCRKKLSTGQCSRFMRPSFYHIYNN